MRCSAFLAASLDGFIARKDGALDWLDPFNGEDHGYAQFFASIDTVLLGRGTYDVVLGFSEWPYAGKQVVVLSHRPAPPRANEQFLQGRPADVLNALERRGAQHVYVDGGKVLSAFIDAGLLDSLTLSVIPVLLGEGTPLFTLARADRPLRLVAHRAFPSGLVQLRYELGK